MSNILGLAGRKQAGKNCAANCVIGKYMSDLGVVRGNWAITPKGQLWISDINGDKRFAGVFDISRQNEGVRLFKEDHLDAWIRLYSYADSLKDVGMYLLGLTYEQCYGTDDDKNSKTNLLWENMPGVITEYKLVALGLSSADKIETIKEATSALGLYYHVAGPMTARDVLQYVGTQIFRRMYPNVWVDATISRIKAEQPELAIISDVRFPNEVERLQEFGGKVMRFTRTPFPNDTHSSEIALNRDKFDWEKFDWVCDNEEMSIERQNHFVLTSLIDCGWIPQVIDKD